VTDRQTDRPTDRPRYSVSKNMPHLRTQYCDAAQNGVFMTDIERAVATSVACVCPGVDIRQDGLPAVLRVDGSELVRVGLHRHGPECRPLRRRLPRRHVGALPYPEAGGRGLGRHLAAVPGRRHPGLPLRRDGLSSTPC